MSGDDVWEHPWLQIERLIRLIVVHRSARDQWAFLKPTLRKVKAERLKIRRAGWFN